MYFPIIKSIMKCFLSIGGAIMNELCTKIVERINTVLRRWKEWRRNTCVSCCAESWTEHPDARRRSSDGGTRFLRIQLIEINIWAVCLCKYMSLILCLAEEFGLIEIHVLASVKAPWDGVKMGRQCESESHNKVVVVINFYYCNKSWCLVIFHSASCDLMRNVFCVFFSYFFLASYSIYYIFSLLSYKNYFFLLYLVLKRRNSHSHNKLSTARNLLCLCVVWNLLLHCCQAARRSDCLQSVRWWWPNIRLECRCGDERGRTQMMLSLPSNSH